MKLLTEKGVKIMMKSRDYVVSFIENPSVDPASKQMLSAETLFSLFTANIIKQKITP